MVSTLIDALSSLPRGTERGFRFLSARGEERYFPYEALEREARRRAAKLAALGLAKGDRVALVIPDAVEFVLSFLGASLAGLVSVPIYPRQSFNFRTRRSYSETVRHVVLAAGARMLLTLASNRDAIEEALAPAPGSRVVVLEDLLGAMRRRRHCRKSLRRISASCSSPPAAPRCRGLVARQSRRQCRAFLGTRGLDLRPDDVAVGWLPLYHDMGLIGFVLGTLICDLPTVLLPTERSCAGRVSGWKRSAATAARRSLPTAYALAARRTHGRDLDGLGLSACASPVAAGPVNADVMRQFCAASARSVSPGRCRVLRHGRATLAVTFHDTRSLSSPIPSMPRR
jgi:fatty-acyl-CoA synthase